MHWTKLPRVQEAATVKWAKKAMWPPAIVTRCGKSYVFFSANDICSDEEIGSIGVAVVGPLHRGDGRAARVLPGSVIERISARSDMVRPTCSGGMSRLQ
ncbi:hypothetical protein EAH75_00930 [Rhodanobacter glycinis]|nr:hypothetical protein EAH75_00930 [Rhodanobacter glycinis]